MSTLNYSHTHIYTYTHRYGHLFGKRVFILNLYSKIFPSSIPHTSTHPSIHWTAQQRTRKRKDRHTHLTVKFPVCIPFSCLSLFSLVFFFFFFSTITITTISSNKFATAAVLYITLGSQNPWIRLLITVFLLSWSTTTTLRVFFLLPIIVVLRFLNLGREKQEKLFSSSARAPVPKLVLTVATHLRRIFRFVHILL